LSGHFEKKALKKLRARLLKTKHSLAACRAARSYDDFASAWSDFLIHSGGVVHILEAGSKTTPQGRQWYGALKRETREDPLLQYIFQARNAEEHQVHDIAENVPSRVIIGRKGETVILNGTFNLSDPMLWLDPNSYFQGKISTPLGKMPSIERSFGGPKLRPIIDDRHDLEFPVPKEHRGKPLANNDPIYIAALYLKFLEETAQKAEAMA